MHLRAPQLKNQSGYIPARWPSVQPLRGARHSVGGSTNAFTLVELIAVIAIVGILMALLLPVVSEAMRSGKAAKTRNEIKSIKTAVDAYFGEYGRLPVPKSVDDQYYSGAGSETIIKALIGKDTTLNPRKIAFLELPTDMVDGTFLDPWGQQYGIIMDNTYDGKIQPSALSPPISALSGTFKVRSIVKSDGLDSNHDNEDDIWSVED